MPAGRTLRVHGTPVEKHWVFQLPNLGSVYTESCVCYCWHDKGHSLQCFMSCC